MCPPALPHPAWPERGFSPPNPRDPRPHPPRKQLPSRPHKGSSTGKAAEKAPREPDREMALLASLKGGGQLATAADLCRGMGLGPGPGRGGGSPLRNRRGTTCQSCQAGVAMGGRTILNLRVWAVDRFGGKALEDGTGAPGRWEVRWDLC